MKFEWERIHNIYIPTTGGSNTYRVKVIGGWVINCDNYTDVINEMPRNISQSMVFVPDPNHEWTIE